MAITCEDVGCQCTELQEKNQELAAALGIDPMKQKVLEAEMRLTNIRTICDVAGVVTPGQALGLIRAIGELAARPLDKEVFRVLKGIREFHAYQDECRRLAEELLKFAGPKEKE